MKIIRTDLERSRGTLKKIRSDWLSKILNVEEAYLIAMLNSDIVIPPEWIKKYHKQIAEKGGPS